MGRHEGSLCLGLVLFAQSCAAERGSPPAAVATEASTPDAGAPVGNDARDAARVSPSPREPSEELQACAELQDDFPPVATIAHALERLNQMQPPVDLSCFVASLPRPLSVVATAGTVSAQPAAGRRSPRVFLLSGTLALSIVPDGEGRHLLEFGQFVTTQRTLKGELQFPVLAPLEPDAPFRRVLYDEAITTCGFCHREEAPHESIPGAFVSLAYQPEARDEVPLAELRHQWETCDDVVEPERCDLLDALFAFGETQQGAFRSEVPLFF